jgi:Ca2+-binding RTX toxin-like protein
VLTGLAGNDTYIVDNEADAVVEIAGEGNDTVRAFGSYSLPAHVENLVLQGTRESSGRGNRLANRIIGNSSHNTLNGGPGNDTLTHARPGPITGRAVTAWFSCSPPVGECRRSHARQIRSFRP